MTITNSPKRFSTPIQARYTETWVLDGHTQTGDQVLGFSGEYVAKTSTLIVHWFHFEFDTVIYETKFMDHDNHHSSKTQSLTVLIDPADLTQCWVNGQICAVHPWEPEDI